MRKGKVQLLMAGLSLVAIGIALVSYKNCNKGCQSFAEHLVEHGAQDIIAALI